MSRDAIPDIIAYWLGSSPNSPREAFARRQWWYAGPPEVDAEIRARFGDLVAEACAGNLDAWAETPDGAFALLLLLDQFTRNIYRNTPDAYRGDARAMRLVEAAIAGGADRALHRVARIWFYHPFHHAEDLAQQNRGLGLLIALQAETPREWRGYVGRSIWGWTRHRNIVARFGRFPHRNAVLGRADTAAERDYLGAGAEAFGQGAKR